MRHFFSGVLLTAMIFAATAYANKQSSDGRGRFEILQGQVKTTYSDEVSGGATSSVDEVIIRLDTSTGKTWFYVYNTIGSVKGTTYIEGWNATPDPMEKSFIAK